MACDLATGGSREDRFGADGSNLLETGLDWTDISSCKDFHQNSGFLYLLFMYTTLGKVGTSTVTIIRAEGSPTSCRPQQVGWVT